MLGTEIMGYAVWELAVIAIYFVAGVVKGGIGLGLPTVSIGLMAAWLPVEQAAGILIISVILTNIWQAFRHRIQASDRPAVDAAAGTGRRVANIRSPCVGTAPPSPPGYWARC